MAPFGYHGCVSVEAVGPDTSKLTYTLIYDEADMDEGRRTSEAARISNRFNGAVAEMKRQAEATRWAEIRQDVSGSSSLCSADGSENARRISDGHGGGVGVNAY